MQQIGLSINDAFAADLFADIESDTSDSAFDPALAYFDTITGSNVLYRSALDRSLGDYAVLSFSIVSVSEFGYPNCSQHILSALLPVVADHLSYDFRQPVFSSARHCFL